MANNFQYDVFLSHNSEDKPRVRRLAEQLKAAGVRVWLDEWVIQAGDIIALKVDEGLEQSRVLLLCISPAALASGWVALERSTAVHRDPANARRRFIPLLLGDCSLPDTLRRYKYVDFREESEAAFAEVLATCQPEQVSQSSSPQPEVQKKPVTKKPKPAKPANAAESLAVLEQRFSGHTDWVRAITFSPDGAWILSGSHDQTVKIWDEKTGQCRATLAESSKLRCVAFTPNGKTVLSSSRTSIITVWDFESNRRISMLRGHARPAHIKRIALLGLV